MKQVHVITPNKSFAVFCSTFVTVDTTQVNLWVDPTYAHL